MENWASCYNRLPNVEAADVAVATSGSLPALLRSFADLVDEHRPPSRVGVVLLHRHFCLDNGMTLIERPIHDAAGPALLTTPSRAEIAASARPARWALGLDSSWIPLEFSDDPAVRAGRLPPQPFMDAYAAILRRLHLQDLLGIALADRATLPLSADEYLIEENTELASEVRKATEVFDAQATIVTMWVPDVAAGCQPTSRCRGWSTCRRTGNPDRPHAYAYGHDRERVHYRAHRGTTN